ncbi:MAG: hypothetical protein H7A24_01565 [Leptospiraceae bacterium]|nr:hypothetical protein [Leptospiraceae bacterium]MCP5510542.1 hypothetical protein [Leptospiraceae bacterium]
MIKTKALEIYEKFDDEQKEFIRSKTIEKNYKPKKLMELFNSIARMDQLNDEVREKLFGWMIGMGMLAAISLISGLIFFPPLIFLSILSILPLGILFFLNRKHTSIDLENNFRIFLVPFLSILKEEMHPDSKIYVKLDCNPIEDESNIINSKTTDTSKYPYTKTNIYSKHWLDLSTELLDHSFLSLSITDVIIKKEKTKRNPRGKIKSKSKSKVVHKLNYQFKFSKSAYDLKPNSGSFTRDDSYFIMSGKKKIASPGENLQLDVNQVLGLIGSAYKQLIPK